MPPDPAAKAIDEEVIVAERNAALRAAFAELPPRCYQLLAMLVGDPPPPYAEISVKLGLPVGSIGPTRARCLERLRRSPHLAELFGGGPSDVDNMSGAGR